MNRRQALRTVTATALSTSRVLGANERIRIGLIGSGSRGQYITGLAKEYGGAEIAVICDVNERRWNEAKNKLSENAEIVKDYRAVLDRKDLDAVIIGSPDHWHVAMLIAAMDAGKDVYIEKPLTHTIAEGKMAIEAVKKAGRIVQVGYQQRSYPHFQEARQMVQSGALGRVNLALSYWYQNYNRRTEPKIDSSAVDWKAWLGSAPEREFDPWRLTQWRWYWDYGGGSLTDLYSHWVDSIHWFMDDYVPSSAQATGGTWVLKHWECPDTITASYVYPKGWVSTYNSTLITAFEDGGFELRGTSATLKITRGGFELFTEESIREKRTVRPPATQAVRAQRDGTIDHMLNFLACVKDRKTPNSPVETAVAAANAAHYGNQAYRAGQKVSTL